MSTELAAAAVVPLLSAAAVGDSLGMACLGRRVFEGAGLAETWDALMARYTDDPEDAGALLDLSTLVQMRGERERGLELQAMAIGLARGYRTVHGSGDALKVLAFVTPGDLMANTPLDFLLEGSDVELITWFVDGDLPDASQLPDHDVAFLAIGQSEESEPLLQRLEAALQTWPRPVLNAMGRRIAALTRDGVAERFAGHAAVACPATCRAPRAALEAIAAGAPLEGLHEGLAYPVIVRPIGSHAGAGLEKLDGPQAFAAYLDAHDQAEFFVARFLDYSGPDGLFRKLRVMFVGGRPFVAHMAVSARWMVHYLNADMGEAAHRAEEAAVMASFDEGFARRHSQAFAALHEAFGLDYFGVDCAETRDGRLVVFEADVAMIVHAMDSPDLYPYKKPAMAKLFAAFVDHLLDAAPGRRIAA